MCAIAMIASYYSGNVSQDRVAYYLNREYWASSPYIKKTPETHLMTGMNVVEMSTALSWALNGVKTYHEGYPIEQGEPENNTKPSSEQIKRWIDEGRPIVRRCPGHYTVIDGYDGDYIHVIGERGDGTETRIHYDDLEIVDRWIPPANAIARSDEPEMWMDSDNDGIVDFDEVNRFFTDPHNPDSDFDGVPDKAEVISYTFLSDGSFDADDVRKPDSNSDGLRAELDWDSDNGEAPDGMEDVNHNGFVDLGETDPSDPNDDPPVEFPVAHFNCQQIAWVNETTFFNATQSYSSSGNITSHIWYFEKNVTVAHEAVMEHKHTKEGVFYMTLEVIDEIFLRASTTNIVTVTYRGDLNKDLMVDEIDVSNVAAAYDSRPGDSNWNRAVDLDKNEWINIVDISRVAVDYGNSQVEPQQTDILKEDWNTLEAWEPDPEAVFMEKVAHHKIEIRPSGQLHTIGVTAWNFGVSYPWQFTIEFKVRIDDFGDGYVYFQTNTPRGSYRFEIHAASLRTGFLGCPCGPGYGQEFPHSTDNDWHIWRVTIDEIAREMKVYKDGAFLTMFTSSDCRTDLTPRFVTGAIRRSTCGAHWDYHYITSGIHPPNLP